MSNMLEILLGLICSLMGIALAYVVLVSLLMGIQFVSKRKIFNSQYAETAVTQDVSQT